MKSEAIKATSCRQTIAKISNECLKLGLYEYGYLGQIYFEEWQSDILVIAYIKGIGWSQIVKYEDRYIATVYVKPEYRRQKYGTKLFKKIEKHWGYIPGVGTPTVSGSKFFNHYFGDSNAA